MDVARAIGRRGIGACQFLVEHSMGGAIAQLASTADPSLSRGDVLLATKPPRSSLAPPMEPQFGPGRQATEKLFAGYTLTIAKTSSLAFFFDERAARYRCQLQPESFRAIADLDTFDVPPGPRSVPMLVLGSARDVLFGRAALEETAQHFDAELSIFEEGCHDVILDPACQEYAAQLDRWLRFKQL